MDAFIALFYVDHIIEGKINILELFPLLSKIILSLILINGI